MENLICVYIRSDVQRSDVYPIKSTFGSGFELDAKKSDLTQVFATYSDLCQMSKTVFL